MSYEWNPVEYLKSCHTRQLMGLRDTCYKLPYGYDVTDNGGNSGCFVTLEQVKAELTTREHVPNKKESKALRQERARKK